MVGGLFLYGNIGVAAADIAPRRTFRLWKATTAAAGIGGIVGHPCCRVLRCTEPTCAPKPCNFNLRHHKTKMSTAALLMRADCRFVLLTELAGVGVW